MGRTSGLRVTRRIQEARCGDAHTEGYTPRSVQCRVSRACDSEVRDVARLRVRRLKSNCSEKTVEHL
jgi:hypothetical protein